MYHTMISTTYHIHNVYYVSYYGINVMRIPSSVKHCNTLQSAATHCHTLQHTHYLVTSKMEVHEGIWNTLQHSAMQSTATHCNTLQHTATHCNTHITWWRQKWRCATAFQAVSALFSVPQSWNPVRHVCAHQKTTRIRASVYIAKIANLWTKTLNLVH